ncbi:MAG: hypothetical protein LBU32_17485 [Clostridiales bacterium]|nr:hypothetical protein [Clostridiales bacterium]
MAIFHLSVLYLFVFAAFAINSAGVTINGSLGQWRRLPVIKIAMHSLEAS